MTIPGMNAGTQSENSLPKTRSKTKSILKMTGDDESLKKEGGNNNLKDKKDKKNKKGASATNENGASNKDKLPLPSHSSLPEVQFTNPDMEKLYQHMILLQKRTEDTLMSVISNTKTEMTEDIRKMDKKITGISGSLKEVSGNLSNLEKRVNKKINSVSESVNITEKNRKSLVRTLAKCRSVPYKIILISGQKLKVWTMN